VDDQREGTGAVLVAAAQPPAFLHKLIPHLADPLTQTPVKLSVDEQFIKSDTGRTYWVSGNIPRLVPEPTDLPVKDPRFLRWAELEELEYQTYHESYVGVFSVSGYNVPEKVGQILNDTCGTGLCLDVGCGILPQPSYMKGCNRMHFFGIDLFMGNEPRTFPFAQAYGEYIPFKDKTFDTVLYASVIDHLYDPLMSLKQAHRVLVDNGSLMIWYSDAGLGLPYLLWKVKRKPAQYNKHHQWGFTERSMKTLARKAGFKVQGFVLLPDNVCRLMIATKDGQ
jgi:SAM-dependent methyltransferase